MDRQQPMSPAVEESFRYCERIAKQHYENFPVATLAMPRRLRPYVWAVYAFARGADDIADEGSQSPGERLGALDRWERQLDSAVAGSGGVHTEESGLPPGNQQPGDDPTDPVFIALGEAIRRSSLPVQPLRDLLVAFRMDVTTSRHRTFDDLLGYCRHSANPVGRLVLHLFGAATAEAVERSDDICTALQLANFWQDIAVDLQKGRMYLPLDDLGRFGYTEQELQAGVVNDRFRALMAFQINRTRALFMRGRPLLAMVGGRLRFELDLIWRGGMAILDAIEGSGYDMFRARPVIGRSDRLRILTAAIFRGKA
jgi:squalene synthase HpnC